MKIYCKTLALTAFISALSMTTLAQNASSTDPQSTQASANEAAQMVPPVATLPHTLEADKDHLDSTFLAELDHKITLSDGTVLPAHTVLSGKITRDLTNDWTNQTLSVKQLNVVSDVDLHSEIASNDSAVFVSSKKHDVKVPAGSELKLAIGPASDASTPANSTPAAN